MAFAGLDLDSFPGLPVMAAVKAETNAVWCGYYLNAPSHSNAGWLGNRSALINQGWGLAPIFVGQQVVGPGSHNVTAAQGTLDGQACASQMATEGFPAGSCVFLDLENGPPLSGAQAAYVDAWIAAVGEAGWATGVYVSHLLAQAVAMANTSTRIWAFNVPTTTQTKASSAFPDPDPSQSGYVGAVLWQRQQNVQIEGPGFNLVVDLDTSTMADPSAPLAKASAQSPIALRPESFNIPPIPTPASVPISTISPSTIAAGAPPTASAKAVQASPPIAAAVTAVAVAAAGAVHVTAGYHVDLSGVIDAAAPYLVTGLILPGVVWLFGRALQAIHINSQSKAAQLVLTAVQNAVNAEAAQAQSYLDGHAVVTVDNSTAARVLAYANATVPQRIVQSGITPTQLAAVVQNRLAQIKTPVIGATS